MLQNDASKMSLVMWIDGLEVFLECTFPNGINESLSFLFAKTKVSPATRYELSRAHEKKPITTWTALKNWLHERRALVLDSDHAKIELRNLRQNGTDPRTHFHKLREISMNITPYDGLDHDVREAFVASLDSRIQPSVRKDYEKQRAQCFRDGTELSDEWLIQITVIEDNHTPKPPKPTVASLKSKSATSPAPTSSSSLSPVVSSVTSVPPEFAKGKITEACRDWMRAHGGCFFYRTLGHVVKDCPRFAKFKLENPDKVRSLNQTSHPLPIVIHSEGEELEVLSSSINVFSATLLSDDRLASGLETFLDYDDLNPMIEDAALDPFI